MVESNVLAFSGDVVANGGYLYTTQARLSSQLANRRITDAVLSMAPMRGRRVIDIGCGDGTYTLDLHREARPAELRGIEPCPEAVHAARDRAADAPVHFDQADAYSLPYESDRFDIAHIRGVLHHLDRPFDAIREAFRVASTVVIVEPNGYNPIVKLLERFSSYHVAHEEKSYPPHRIDGWIKGIGGTPTDRRYIGLVPFFCPDGFARLLKRIEPIVERLPIIRALGCGQYVVAARRG